MPPKPKFADGEKVFCFYDSKLYEAKALKSSISMDKKIKYFIHYISWPKSWEEWAEEDRVLKFNDSNIQKQKDLAKQLQEQNTSRELKRGASERDSRDEGSKKKKRLNDSTIETEETFLTKTEVKIKIPKELKPWLVNDWDAINRQHKLLEIPAKKTVKDIIDSYITMKKSNKSKDQGKEAAVIDAMYGLVTYFNVMLGSQLLYESERPQYADILKKYPDTPMANLYGSFYLLRLFVRLGSVLAHTALNEKDINSFMQHVQDFLKYLMKNIGIYFSMQRFVNVTPEYSRKAQ